MYGRFLFHLSPAFCKQNHTKRGLPVWCQPASTSIGEGDFASQLTLCALLNASSCEFTHDTGIIKWDPFWWDGSNLMQIIWKNPPFNHVFGADRILRAWYRGEKCRAAQEGARASARHIEGLIIYTVLMVFVAFWGWLQENCHVLFFPCNLHILLDEIRKPGKDSCGLYKWIIKSPVLGPQNHEKWRVFIPKIWVIYPLKMKVLGSHGVNDWFSAHLFSHQLSPSTIVESSGMKLLKLLYSCSRPGSRNLQFMLSWQLALLMSLGAWKIGWCGE